MIEILFRGKRKDILPGNEWVFGFLINHPNSSPEIGYEYNEEWEDNQCEYVVPETVGQYTGMNDINGNKIYEGDIVHCKARIDRANMFVTFEDGKFVMVLCEEFKTHKRGLGHYEIECFDKEVIGNIYDNPELLTNENNG